MKCVSLSQFDLKTMKHNKHSFPCGQCIACKINNRRKWTARILLESMSQTDATWLTLTYDEKNMPVDGELIPDHLSKFIRALRKRINHKIRYFACGEYGDKFGRPHYHAIIWGYHPHVVPDKKDPRRWYDPIIEKAWGKGGTMVEDLKSSNRLDLRCAYIAAYVVKKFRNKGSIHETQEFARMSKRPGIGTSAVPYIVDTLTTEKGAMLCAQIGTVPDQFRYRNKMWPIPPIIRKKIAEELNYPYLPISVNINTTDVLTMEGKTVKSFSYGPPPEIEEDTPYKAFVRGEKARKRLEIENSRRAAPSNPTREEHFNWVQETYTNK